MTARTYIVVLLLLAGRVALGQDDFGSIHMTVLDAETNRPIPFATVFVSQTTIGGNTNEQGVIDIKKIPLGSHLLVISEVGHVSQQRKVVIRGPQTIHMTVKLAARVLAEVVVVAKHDRKWRRHLKRFEKLFFGPDHFKQCEIKNPSVLHFEIEHGEFTADAKEALKIENNFLGYNLRFTIGNCFFNAKKFTILGNIAYEEKQGTEKQMSRWKENREKVYRGSPQHFLRSVLDSTLDKDGFKVYNDITDSEKIFRGSTLSANLGKTIVRDSIEKRVTPAAYGMYSFGLPGRLEVHYLRKRAWSLAYTDIGHSISWFEVKPGTQIIVSRSGIIQNPESITVVGNMSKLRVADWLPLNYKYAEDFAPEPIIPKRPGMALLEKPYVQTDRDYYYNGETMWLKGYMSYTVPLMKDTLSRSAHVELSDSNGNIIATKFYPMEDGNFEGDIPLGKNWRPGSYQLKVYTAWMLNFDRRMIFTKTINILGEFEAVKVAKDYQISTDTLPNIWLQSDKKQYSPREKITLTIDVTDSLEFSTGSDLSISVTDLEQAVPHKKEKTIITNYLYEEIPLDDPNKEVAYDIEYGVPFNGRFILGRQQTQGSLTFFQDNTREAFGIITDTTGVFKKSLLFNDTIDFYVSALSANSKKGKVVMDTSRLQSPKLPLERLPLDIYSATANRDARNLRLNGSTLLEEVAVKSTKILPNTTPARVVMSGDYTVTGAWATDRNYTDIFLALTARVPGLRYDPATATVKLLIGQYSSLGSGDPLIVVDGVTLPDASDVLQIPIRSIDYVDVYKYASSTKWGARASGGVIEIHTKGWTKRDPDDHSFDKRRLQLVKWIGYSTTSTFSSPDYGKPVDNEYYDYRATIYWSPSVSTNGKDPVTVSFYAADAATKYRIVVEGVTDAGIPVRAEKIVEVINER